MSELPPGWTEDMNISLPPKHSLEEVVDYVISAGIEHKEFDALRQHLVEEFGLSPEDADLAWDRVHGGIVRAATGASENCPGKELDPLAWLSFHRATCDPSIVAALYPHMVRPKAQEHTSPQVDRKPWWRFWR